VFLLRPPEPIFGTSNLVRTNSSRCVDERLFWNRDSCRTVREEKIQEDSYRRKQYLCQNKCGGIESDRRAIRREWNRKRKKTLSRIEREGKAT